MKVKAYALNIKSFSITVFAIVLSISAFAQESVAFLQQKLQNAKSDSAKIAIYRKIYDHFQYSQSDSTTACLEDGLKQFTAKNYKLGIASLTSLLGFLDVHHGSIATARKRQTDALKIFEEINNKRGIGAANNSLGIMESKSGNFDAAVKHFITALKAFQIDSNRDGIISTYMNLGIVNQINNNLDKALEFFNKALSLVKDTNDVRSVCNLYNNIGIVYGMKGKLDTSLVYFEKALAMCSTPEYIDLQLSCFLNMGIVYQKFGDDAKALENFNEGLRITKDRNMPEDYARTLSNVSTIVAKTNPEKAIAQLKEALDISKKLGQKSLLEEIYSYLVDDYKKTGNYKDALSIMEDQRVLEDSTSSIEKAKEIANLQSVYQLEESDATIKELKLIQQKNLLRRNIIIVVAVVLAIGLIVILVYYRKTMQLNEKLSKREADLEKLNKIKDKLFSIIGHDLRGPIGNIPMMLQILEEENTSPEERKFLHDTLMAHVQASKETLDKLLYWGNSQIKGYDVKPEAFDISEYISKDINLLNNNATQKNITIINKIHEHIRIFGEPTHFDFIFRNLLSNAIKFTYAGGIIELSADTGKMPGYTVFAVKDTGVGIEKERISQIFEPFTSKARGTADESGTSIGLMLCKEFVTENGGNIWVESEPGKGSTFYFSFRNAA